MSANSQAQTAKAAIGLLLGAGCCLALLFL